MNGKLIVDNADWLVNHSKITKPDAEPMPTPREEPAVQDRKDDVKRFMSAVAPKREVVSQIATREQRSRVVDAIEEILAGVLGPDMALQS